ncbi:MAG: UbiA family prenyltransferase, partial [Candidatus Thorarchaeota archaeon]
IKDRNKDKIHPEKQNRPIASGEVSLFEAFVLLIITIGGSLLIAAIIPNVKDNSKILFISTLILIFFTNQLYTYYFKHIALFDVTFIALNYIWRAIAGVVIINVYLSPWLFALGFLFALFLALAKRRGDIILLGNKAKDQRKVFEVYTLPLLDQFISIVAGSMIVAWAIYIIEAPFRTNVPVTFTNENLALLSIPLITITIMKLVLLLQTNGKYARRAEFIFFDRDIIILGVLSAIIIILAIYWNHLENQLIKVFSFI